MGSERADVVIVGAGLAGPAAARAMTSRGRSVVLVEAFRPGHRHGSARIFRRAYPDPLYVRLTGQAQVLWHQLADEAGEELVTVTGWPAGAPRPTVASPSPPTAADPLYQRVPFRLWTQYAGPFTRAGYLASTNNVAK